MHASTLASMTHLVLAIAAAALIVFCTLLPFLPGRYDGLAVAISAMAQVFGMAGLLLVPVGASWLVHDWTSSGAGNEHRFAAAALIVLAVVCLVVSCTAFAFSGASAGVATLAISICMLWNVASRLRRLRREGKRPARAIPLYLLVVPAAVAAVQAAVIGPASEFSRNRAIRNSERLIADIERYRARTGRYPPSLMSVSTDYRPQLTGIRQYHYEPCGAAYNLFFEQRALALDTREIVMYNRLDEHVMTSHDMDLLEFESADLNARRGYYAVRPAAHPHWKYFLFD